MVARRLIGLLALFVVIAATPVAAQDAEAEPPGADGEDSDEAPQLYARVIVDSTPLRSGPSSTYRQLGVARRGQVFLVRQRATRGYWFQVERPDGTLAWLLGDAVYNHEVGQAEATGGRLWPNLFAPPPLLDAHVEIAITFGALAEGGFMALRPSVFLAPELGIELGAAASVSGSGRILMGTGGGILNIFPRSPVVPYMVAGGGVAVSTPNADTFLLESGTVALLYAGGGLRFGFRYRITLRIEARAYAFFEPDRYVAMEEYSGGLTVFF